MNDLTVMFNNFTNIDKMNNYLKPLNKKKTTYDNGNPDPMLTDTTMLLFSSITIHFIFQHGENKCVVPTNLAADLVRK